MKKYVSDNRGPVVMKGRIDAILRNLLIEFKENLKNVKIEEAENQIKKYIIALQDINYDCVISDGSVFIVYQPRVIENAKHFDLSMLELIKIDELDIHSVEPEDVYLWFDRYFLKEKLIKPDTERFSEEFGTNSVLFRQSEEMLKGVWKEVKDNYKTLYTEWADYLRIVYGTAVDSENLFLRHTYLATLSKLMVYMFYSEGHSPSKERIKQVIDGEAFREFGILNFLDEDFFAWVDKSEDGMEFCKLMRNSLQRYDLTQINEDILKGLYQDLVDPKERHDLGEYYTPDWLADYIIQNLVKTKFSANILDPSCGSGTFLVFSIIYKKKMLGYSKQPSEILQNITNSVFGIDIHPLAVIIARANYIMALGNLLKIGRKGKVVIPIYLADSLKTPEKETEIKYATTKVFRRKVEDKVYLKIPYKKLIIHRKDRTTNISDELVDAMNSFSFSCVKNEIELKRDDFESFIVGEIPELSEFREKQGKEFNDIIDVFFDNAKTLANLIRDGKDTIWAFILKNFYKPIMLKDKFDFIVGNPPWLSYRYVKSIEYQKYLKKLISEDYKITKRASLMTHMELAALFFLRAPELFLKDGGKIAFVMPRGIFSADQYESIRNGECRQTVSLENVYDLDKVSPLFNVPSCVMMGTKGEKTKDDFDAIIFSGKLKRKNSPLNEAKEMLNIKESKLFLGKIGSRTFISEEKINLEGEKSYYFDRFSQGATIVPRQFWFVDMEKHSVFGSNPLTPSVKTSKRAIESAKPQYKGVRISGNIEKEFLFGTLTGTELVPFGNLGIQTVILPLERDSKGFRLLDIPEAKKKGKNNLAKWLSESEKIWKEKRGEKADKLTIYNRLDYSKGITGQNPKSKYKVLYNTSGMYLCCCVLEMNKFKDNFSGIVADAKAYYFDLESKDEAYYLSSILNSKIIDKLLKPMQSKGLFGQRDIHKKPLEIPIPRFNSADKNHLRLSELGKMCSEKVEKELPEISGKYKSIGKVRSAVRKVLSEEMKEMSRLVEIILEESKNGLNQKW